jgi:hypothetical protein
MAAEYPANIKTFNTKDPGDPIQSAHINDLQDEVVAIETQLGTNVGTWQSYTPAWTANTGTPSLGNGTITGKYFRLGKMVIVNISLTFGSTTSAAGTSTWYISLPITSAGLGHGVWTAYDSGVKYHTGILQVFTGATRINSFYASDGQGYLSETRPHTWKANDYLNFTAIYQVA